MDPVDGLARKKRVKRKKKKKKQKNLDPNKQMITIDTPYGTAKFKETDEMRARRLGSRRGRDDMGRSMNNLSMGGTGGGNYLMMNFPSPGRPLTNYT